MSLFSSLCLFLYTLYSVNIVITYLFCVSFIKWCVGIRPKHVVKAPRNHRSTNQSVSLSFTNIDYFLAVPPPTPPSVAPLPSFCHTISHISLFTPQCPGLVPQFDRPNTIKTYLLSTGSWHWTRNVCASGCYAVRRFWATFFIARRLKKTRTVELVVAKSQCCKDILSLSTFEEVRTSRPLSRSNLPLGIGR